MTRARTGKVHKPRNDVCTILLEIASSRLFSEPNRKLNAPVERPFRNPTDAPKTRTVIQ